MMPSPAEPGERPAAVPPELLAQFSDFVEARIGVHFRGARADELGTLLARAARDSGAGDVSQYVKRLMSEPPSRAHIERLAAHLTVGETYFFRDAASFECFERHVIPELVRARAATRRVRIWSAGCSTGEEAYSLAIAWARARPEDGPWDMTVLATDIAPAALRKASLAIYDHWSFRGTPEAVKRDFFRPLERGRLEVCPAIRSSVRIAHLNLAEDAADPPGDGQMDVIFCRNVLMYFEARRADSLLRKLDRALAPGGWLFLAPVEIPRELPPGLVRVHVAGAIALHKAGDVPLPAVHLATQARADAPRRERRSSRRHDKRPLAARSPADPWQQALRKYESGDFGEALAVLGDIVARNPREARAMALVARIRANQSQLDEAAAWCERAIRADKLSAEWPYLHAMVLLEQGRIADAASALRRAIYLSPQSAIAHWMLGNVARHQGFTAEAARHWRNALGILATRPVDEVIEAADGMTAGRLAGMIRCMLEQEGEG